MRSMFPFTDYDFWAYISSGFVTLFCLDHSARMGLLIRPTWTVVEILFAVACAYVTGHLVAGLASAIIERRITRKWLRPPSLSLFAIEVGPKWFRFLYPAFYEPLPEKTRHLIFQKAATQEIASPGEELFWLAFESARSSRATMERLSSFLNQYGMCRNLTFAGLLSVCFFVAAYFCYDDPNDLVWAIVAFVASVGMFLRYLKFYRHYAVEVFTHYAHS